ncbi:MAG: hypothetical protein ACTSYL_04985 [Candidatus Thorarchaeota archaeon]
MKKTATLLMMAILLLSVFAATNFASAQSTDPYTRVTWKVVDEVKDFEHAEENSQWIFGPQPTIVITYAENGTDIADNDYLVNVGTDLYVNITIPSSFLGEGNSLDSLLFWGSGHLPKSPIFVLQYNATADDWNRLCFSYEPGSQEPTSSNFLALNSTESSYKEYSDGYVITFAISFVDDVGPKIFWTGMQVTDTEGRPVTLSWLSRIQRGDFESPPIGLGVKVDRILQGFPSYYYAKVTDSAGEILHYVGVDDPYTFTVQANEELGEVVVPFTILTFDPDYQINNPIVMPNDAYKHITGWTAANLSMPFLNYVYNSTGAFAVAGYLTDIQWHWSYTYNVWVVTFNITLDQSLDISKFYVLEDTSIESGGASVSWTGHFTNMTDMNPSEYEVGATITPDPYFWTVTNTEGVKLIPRPEIAEHNTVRLAFEDQFIEGTVTKDGEVVGHVLQGDILNVSLDFFGDGGKVNGSYYVLVNKSHAFEDEYGTYDLDGYLVYIDRDNLTLYVQGSGSGNNETTYWTTFVVHSMTLDFEHNVSYSNSTAITTYMDSDRNFIRQDIINSSSMVTVLDFKMVIGEDHSVIWFTMRFESSAPSMKVDTAFVKSGYHVTAQYNVSLSGSGIWQLYPPLNWSNADTGMDIITDDILWTPRHFVLGTVRFWEAPKWTVTEDGAIDLDGNVYTTEDQYFVKRTGTWHDWGNTTIQGMGVGVMFDPSPLKPGDEFHSYSWMGVVDFIIEFEASENFYWFHADDFSPVNSTEMADIQDTLWANMTEDIPMPGYEWVAWLSKNRTIDLSEFTGLDGNTWETTWFAWGTEQAFQVSTSATSTTWAAFRARYAGLLLFKDSPDGASKSAPDFSIENGKVVTDEVTHVVLIDNVESIAFRRPFGATNDTGDVRVSPDTEVSFGISIYNVSVTFFPLQVTNADGIRGPWQLRQSYEGSLGLDPANFDSWISHGNVTEMAFDITFNVDMVNYDPDDPTTWNHAVSFKVDQQFGTWQCDEFNSTVFDGYGLAVNFFGILGTGTRTEYKAGDTPVTDPNSASVNASYYQFGADDSPFANVSMGGLPYTWGGDNFTTTYISGSSTAPIGAFSVIYENQNGETITDWEVEASMLFMTAGYDHWSGKEIRCDPVFVSYTSASQTPLPPTTTTTTTTTSTGTTSTTTSTVPPTHTGFGVDTYVLVGGGLAVVVILLALTRRRK